MNKLAVHQLLGSLPRTALAAHTDALGLAVEDRRSTQAHIDALMQAQEAGLELLLRALPRDLLKQLCRNFNLDDGGRDKEPIVQRLLPILTPGDSKLIPPPLSLSTKGEGSGERIAGAAATREGSGERIAFAGNDYVTFMIDLLRRSGGTHYKGGKSFPLTTLRAVKTPHEWLHAESETGLDGDPRLVAVSFGPRHAPVTPRQVLDAIQQTRGYDIVLFVGFACDPEALRIIEMGAPKRELQFVHAAPDILVGDLLKTKKATKLFTVFGLPDVKVKKEKEGRVVVSLTGVDIYDPTTGETSHDDGANVAAWFLDHDYDGRTFCLCQAFFPAGKAKNPWEKLQKALKGSIDEEKFEALRGTDSIPFKPGKRVAVKVIDDRGNEVVKVVEVTA